jgi:hypothetical protein
MMLSEEFMWILREIEELFLSNGSVVLRFPRSEPIRTKPATGRPSQRGSNDVKLPDHRS